MSDISVGSTVAGCRVEAVAGRGGMGVVFRATQTALRRPVALKVIAPHLAQDAAFRARFTREARIAASIDHPNVIPIYETGELDGSLYLMMRWVDGTDLRSLLAAEGRLSPSRAIALMRPVALALAAAHRRGLVHRDVKPANVLIATADGTEEHVYLTDFGIARYVEGDTPTTRTGVLVGTLDYIAPERIEGGRGDAGSDIYAFGCMLFELLTGSVPFGRTSDLARMHAHLNDPPPSARTTVADVPPLLDSVIACAMAKQPAERYATASELATALQRAGEQAESEPGAFRTRIERARAETDEAEVPTTRAAPPSPPAPRPAKRWARRRAVVSVGLLGVVAALGGVVFALAQGSGSPTPAGHQSAAGTHAETTGTQSAATSTAPTVAQATTRPLGSGTAKVLRSQMMPPPRAAPAGLAAEGATVWAADAAHGRVVALATDAPVKSIAVGGHPDSVAVDRLGRLWVTNTGDRQVTVLDPGSGRSERVTVGLDPGKVAVSGGAAWVLNRGEDSISRINLNTLRPVRIGLRARPDALVAAYARIWVATDDEAVTVLDQKGRQNSIEGPRLPSRAVAGAASDGVWFLGPGSGTGATLTRIDPRATRATQVDGRLRYAEPAHQPSVAGQPIDMAADSDHSVLVGAGDTLTVFGTNGDDDRRVLGTVRFGATVGRVAVGDRRGWVGLPAGDRVYQIKL